jgi:hypothetical protein
MALSTARLGAAPMGVMADPRSPAAKRRLPHYVYATSGAGTVHLINFDAAARWDNPAPLCGTGAGQAPLRQGDETLSGVSATCKRCRKIAGLAKSTGGRR